MLDVLFENRADVMRDEVDIAVMAEPPPSLVARDLGNVRYLACASREYAAEHGVPTGLAQLATAPWSRRAWWAGSCACAPTRAASART